jgi:hypothetical protein
VIQYRTRGLPWYVILPSFLIVALVAAAGSYSFLASRARPYPFTGPLGGPVVQSPPLAPATDVKSGPAGLPALASTDVVADLIPGPLSLNTQPVGPTPTHVAKVSQETAKPAEPTPAPTKAQPPAADSNTASPSEPPQATAPVAATASGDVTRSLVAATPNPAEKPVVKNPLAVGFSIPANVENPFDVLPISPKTPGLPRIEDREGPSTDQALADAAGPDQQATPSLKELNDQLQAEAAEKKADINQIRDLKDRARSQVDAEALARVDEERATFHDQLSEIVQSRSSKAGKQIDDLCNQYGRAYDTELRAKINHYLSRMNGRTSREVKVKFLRDMGVPEPAILDFLANEIHRYINSRNGPRDSNQVRVNAAKLLLSYKLPKSKGSASKAINPLMNGQAR